MAKQGHYLNDVLSSESFFTVQVFKSGQEIFYLIFFLVLWLDTKGAKFLKWSSKVHFRRHQKNKIRIKKKKLGSMFQKKKLLNYWFRCLNAFLATLMCRCCSSEVDRAPNDRQVVGLNPTMCRFFLFSLPLQVKCSIDAKKLQLYKIGALNLPLGALSGTPILSRMK